MSNRFNLTDLRLEEVKTLLGRQYSIRYAANKIGCSPEVLTDKLKELGHDPKQLKSDGINTMKADLIGTINDIEEPEKKAKATLDFLKHYDTSDDVASSKQSIDASVTLEKCYLPLKDESN